MTGRNFSLTHPEPRTARQPHGGRDWSMEAHDRLLDIEHANLDFEEALTASSATADRLFKGDMWLRRNGNNHPKAQQARKVHNGLIGTQQQQLHILKARFVRLWLCVCALHGTLNQTADPQAWLDKHAPQIPANTPQALWKAYQPERSPPFTTWPCDEAYYIDNRPFTYETLTRWMHRETT